MSRKLTRRSGRGRGLASQGILILAVFGMFVSV